MEPINSYSQLAEMVRVSPDQWILEAYTQSFRITSLASGATTTATSNIDASAYFVWCKTTYFGTVANAQTTDSSRVIPNITVQLTDSGSQRQLFDIPQTLSNIAGYGGIPQILEQPYLFKPNSTLSGSFVSYEAAATVTNLFLTLIGYRARRYGGNTISG